MHFVDVVGFDIKEGKMRDFQEWVRNNEKEIAAQLPDGAEHMGFFISIYDSQKDAGSVTVMTRMDSYGTADAIAALGGTNETYGRLMSEAFAFIDDSNTGNGSRRLLKAVSDATIWE